MGKPELGARLRLGYMVIGILLVVEVTEYLVGTRMRSGAWPYLAILAVLGAWPILYYFMHLKQLWSSEE